MNPRQRRGVLLMILAALGSVAVFVSVLSYVGDVRARVGNKRPVLQLTEDVTAQEQITADMVKEVTNPAKWTPETALRDISALQGQVAASDLPEGSYLQEGSVMRDPALQPGQREIAIMINAETGVAGKIDPGSVVDIYATFQATDDHAACAVRVLSSVRVIDVGELRPEEGSDAGEVSQDTVVPITFALPGNSSLDLTYVEAFAQTVRLARIGGVGESSSSPISDWRVCEIPRTDEASAETQSDTQDQTDTQSQDSNRGQGGSQGQDQGRNQSERS